MFDSFGCARYFAGACLVVLASTATGTAAPTRLYTELWHHQGPNYNPDLYFPDSGSSDGDHNSERNVKGMPLPLPPASYATSCGPSMKRAQCTVQHLSGAGHCEFVSWARPDDPTDCGCIAHFGANGAEWDQVCRVTVTVEPIKQPKCPRGLCLKPLPLNKPRPAFPFIPKTLQPHIWAWIDYFNDAALALEDSLERAEIDGSVALMAVEAGGGAKELQAYRNQLARVQQAAKALAERETVHSKYNASPVLDAYFTFLLDLPSFVRPAPYSPGPERSCLRGHQALHDVAAYLRAVGTDTSRAGVAAALHELNLHLHCMSAIQALQLNAGIAAALEQRPRPPEVQRQLRVNLLPVTLLVLEMTKAAGSTPLQRHVIRYFADYAQAWNVADSIPAAMGLWLPQPISGDLHLLNNFCERSKDVRCVSGLGILRGLTDPLAIGLGDCSIEQMIGGGLRASGAYACTADVCVAAEAKLLGQRGAGLPHGILKAIATNSTQQGIPLTAQPMLDQCGLDSTGKIVGSGASGGGGSDPVSTPSQVLGCIIGQRGVGDSMLKCVAKGIAVSGGVFGSISAAPAQPKVRGDVCTKGDNTPDGTGTTQPQQNQEVKKAVDTVADNLKDPNVVADIKRVTQGWVDPKDVEVIAEQVADDLAKGRIPVVPMAEGPLTDKFAGLNDGSKIWYNAKFTANQALDAPGSLTNVLTHEVLHIVFDKLHLNDDKTAESRQHFWMFVGGLTWPSACPQGNCSGFDPDSVDCSAVSMRVQQLMSCASTPPQSLTVPKPIDPSPLDPSGPDHAALLKCLGQPLTITFDGNCGYLDCGDQAATRVNGACVCNDSNGSPGSGFNVRRCGAFDCGAGGTVVTGPGGCSCVTAGSVQLDASGAIVRRWGTASWVAPSLDGRKLTARIP